MLIPEDASSIYLMLLVSELIFNPAYPVCHPRLTFFTFGCSFFFSLFSFEGLCLPFVSWRVLWFTWYFWHFRFLFSRVRFCSWFSLPGACLWCLFLMCSLFFDCELMLFGTLSENSLRPGWKSHSSRDDVCLLLPGVWRHYKPRFTKTKCSAVAFGVP